MSVIFTYKAAVIIKKCGSYLYNEMCGTHELVWWDLTHLLNLFIYNQLVQKRYIRSGNRCYIIRDKFYLTSHRLKYLYLWYMSLHYVHDVYVFIIHKNRHKKWEKLFIKNKHQNKQLQIKRASLQMLLM